MKIKTSKIGIDMGLKIEPSPFSSAKPGEHIVWKGGSGIGTVFTQEEADTYCEIYQQGWYEGKRQAFLDILEATNTRIGGFC